uniref:GBF-interacting protein 1 N-terminal domain-containing protein n=1 Tax=Anthurium amnicola TaxID=1678845 RepID=A0A1D1XR72_9ARAE
MSNPGKMSGGGSSRVSIPSSLRKTIQDIKEIAGNHSDEVILAMLEECSMDPNETAQKLLFQDTFHEVKRKRERKKENSKISPLQNSNNREPIDSRWKPGMQRREVRSGRGAYSSRYMSHDAGVPRNFNVSKENGVSQVTEKGITSAASLGIQETKHDSGVPTSSSAFGVYNGPNKPSLHGSSQELGSQMAAADGFPSKEESSFLEDSESGVTLPSLANSKSGPETVLGVMHGQPVQSSYQFPPAGMPAAVSGVYASASDPILAPSLDAPVPGVVGSTIKREVASERIVVESINTKVVSDNETGFEISSSEEAVSERGSSSIQGKMQSKSQIIDVNHLPDVSQPSPSSHFGSSSSRPSFNYSNRSQLIVGAQKVETNTQSDSGPTEETTSKLQKKMEELHFSYDQHVIIPNHLQVPEAERTGLSFGSFDASFNLGTRFMNGPCGENCSMQPADSSQVPEGNIEESTLITQNTSLAIQEDVLDHPRSPQMPDNLSSGETDVSSNIAAVSEHDQNKQEIAVAQRGPQVSVVHTAPTYSTFGLIPQILGGQFAPFESSEPQARDASPLPGFVVQQPFDHSPGYYTQIYQPGGDSNGRFSPFLAQDTSVKCNGNVAVLTSQTGQTVQENANSVIMSTTGPTPIVTQAVGVMPTSVAVNQQPVPVFRHPAGVHISPYPPNYIPYQYFSPFYVPPHTIQHFLSNAAFVQQPLAGSIYPPPTAAAAATPVKNSLSQFKTGANSGISTHSGLPTGFGPYSSIPTGYSPSPDMTSGNSTVNEDISLPQYKENDVYITGQQSEGSAVWIPPPGRDVPSVHASSLYNIPQGQHMTFTSLQSGHGAFNGIYHPSQSVAAATVHPLLQPSQTMAGAVEMVGRPAGVYQQPQRTQMNWANNY